MTTVNEQNHAHNGRASPTLLQYAIDALAAGLCVLPVAQDGSKKPGLSQWKSHQTRVPTHEEIATMFHPRQQGIGAVTGAISGNLEVLDFDRHNILESYCEIMRGLGYGPLLDRVMNGYCERSPNGAHIPYRCETIEGNQKLAVGQDRKALIETRGEGGFIVIAPSCGRTHDSGKPYELVSGGLDSIATITPAERKTLLDVARSLTEIVPEDMEEKDTSPHEKAARNGNGSTGTRPGDIYAARATWEDILAPHGWVKLYEHAGKTYWRRPGKDRGVSATTNFAGSNLLFVFSTSTDFESERGYGKFSAYTLLNHHGDFIGAAAALMRKGYFDTGAAFHTNGNGASHGADSGRADEEEAFTDDSRENDQTASATAEPPHEEKPEPPRHHYPCPDLLRRGIFKIVSDKLGVWSWEVWHGTFAALSARAHKNLNVFYYSDPIFGNSYSLLVNRTAAGKNLVSNVIRALLADSDYKIRTGVSSGQGLLPLLTDDSLKSKDGRLIVHGVPLLLLCSEWSRIAQMANIQHSVLWENLNELFMCHATFSQSRSHKNGSGGDVVVMKPTLTIAGTTTQTLFAKAATPQTIECGALNRYLIVPGNAEYVPYTGQNYNASEALQGTLDHLITHTLGHGQRIMDIYCDEAWQSYQKFQEAFITPMERNENTSLIFGRLHLHVHHTAALLAWSEESPTITLEHTQAAQELMRISHAFVSELLDAQATTFEPTVFQVVDNAMERQVLDRVKKHPGLTRREVARPLTNTKSGYAAWMRIIDGLIRAEVLKIETKGQRDELRFQ